MCEFKVLINGKIMFRDAVYAQSNGQKIIVKDILGDSQEFQHYTISEVNVKTQQLILSPTKP